MLHILHRGRVTLTAIASGKGGTGKTFLATNLAQALSYERERVLLFDGDLGLSNIVVQLGLTQQARFAAMLAGECAAHDAAVPFAGGAKRRGGFDVLAGPPGSGDLAAADASTLIRTMASLRLAAGYDRVILDLGAGVDETVLRLAASADQTIAVLTPDPSALTDAYALIKLLAKRTHGRAADFVVNQANSASDARVTGETLINACRSFLTVVPKNLGYIRRDPKVADAIRHQSLLSAVHQNCVAACDISALAQKLARAHAGAESPARAASMR
jgi:flagellar biosynthesis protein FlhG